MLLAFFNPFQTRFQQLLQDKLINMVCFVDAHQPVQCLETLAIFIHLLFFLAQDIDPIEIENAQEAHEEYHALDSENPASTMLSTQMPTYSSTLRRLLPAPSVGGDQHRKLVSASRTQHLERTKKRKHQTGELCCTECRQQCRTIQYCRKEQHHTAENW